MDINVSEIALVHQTDGRCIPMITCECGNWVNVSAAYFSDHWDEPVVCASCGRTLHLKFTGEKPADKDVTTSVEFGWNDDETLPLLKCVCGEKFDYWSMIISIYRDTAYACSKCKRRLYFRNEIRVFEVIDE